MDPKRHIMRCLVAGFVALLPVGGLVLLVVYLEFTIAQAWLGAQDFYFPGLGLLATVLGLYAIGLVITTFVGKWIWSKCDGLLDRLPAVGSLYQTLKQVLGYGGGESALFRRAVLVPSIDTGGQQLGLVTDEHDDGRCLVYLPNAPNPANGRLVLLDAADLSPLDAPAGDVLKSLVSLGKADVSLRGTPGQRPA